MAVRWRFHALVSLFMPAYRTVLSTLFCLINDTTRDGECQVGALPPRPALTDLPLLCYNSTTLMLKELTLLMRK